MNDDLAPDHASFSAHCQRLLAAGCHGLSVFGTTGEANSLSVTERLAALEALIEVGVPADALLPGTGSCALTDTVYLSRAALEAGTAGVLVLPPFYYKGVGDEGLFRFFAEVVERIGDDGLRLYLYHIPQMTDIRARSAPDLPPHRCLPRRDSGHQRQLRRRGTHRDPLPGVSKFLRTSRNGDPPATDTAQRWRRLHLGHH
jgi:hypothetical protein